MVIVEFFDKVSLENICSALLCHPEQVILVGANRNRMVSAANTYHKLLRSKGIKTEFSCITSSRNNLRSIVDKLSRIVDDCNGDCIFDLTGGDDLYLVAVGIIMERYGEKVQCHRFNFMNDKLCDCDADGKVLDVRSFDISVEDNIAIYGGDMIDDPNKECYTYPWNFSNDFISDIESMWSICRKNPRLWNAQINTLCAICDIFGADSPLEVFYNQETVQYDFCTRHIKYTCIPWMLWELQKFGLISSLYIGDTVSFRFKNEQVKRCLTTAGQILELFIASRLLSIKDTNGSPLYNDVKVGTVINWGQDEHEPEIHTINEIDVLAMKGAIPVFISCKNGLFDANELYKLNTVADRFGNKYAKKILIATDMDGLGAKGEYLTARMEDMGIKCVGDLDQLPDTELDRILASLWNG
jgi:hypothetical protein